MPLAGRPVDAVCALARQVADDWLYSEGLEGVTISSLSRSNGTAGVTFTITVGRGPGLRADGSVDQRGWTWSARVLYWADVLAKATRPPRTPRLAARPNGMASVTQLPVYGPRALFGTGPAPRLGAGAPPWMIGAVGDPEDHFPADND